MNLGAFYFLTVLAASPDAPPETVVVTATRLPRPGFDLPAAIEAIDARTIREDNPQVNLSETLNRVPGIVVQNRQNYAQDLQVSSRGFGARATFGVRGVRLIADGIPATMPDGQGQAATFDLGSAARIEVLRGPFSSLYGNASGGVVQVFTADGTKPAEAGVTLSGGSFGQQRAHLRAGGREGALDFVASISRYETEGYRDHSAATRDQANAKVNLDFGVGRLALIVSAMNQPDTQDPLGLARAQFEANPRQVDAAAIAFDTRKTIRQKQAGLVFDSRADAEKGWHARAYGGDRRVVQYLGQSGDTPLGSGGVVDLDRGYAGLGVRWTRRLSAATLAVGVDHDRMSERRRGYVNDSGRRGALRRDEDDGVTNTDIHAQFEWPLDARWSLSGGARRSVVRFESDDHFVSATNPDDSGRMRYANTTPVAGMVFKAAPHLNLYANAGAGFETPTFAELAYRPAGGTGLNFELRPARSRHVEAGVKARVATMRLEAAVFRIETRDEIVTNTSAGGRSDFKNASRTRRTGAELLLEATLSGGFEARLALTSLDARFTEAFTTGSPAVVVPAGRNLPGVPRTVAQGEIVWRSRAGLHAGVELRHSGKVAVNEANSDAGAAYTVANARLGYQHRWGGWSLREFVRVDNVANRRYAGSVIVAEARGRYFEPAPGRNFFAGIEATF